MIVYENIKSGFIEDLRKDVLVEKISNSYREKVGGIKESEKRSWENSLKSIVKILDNEDIPGDTGIAVEYQCPGTSSRIDFMISGYDENGKGIIIIVELKQWSKVEEVEDSLLVRALVAKNHIEEKAHPSRQALNYAGYLSNLIEPVIEDKIRLYPCSYLHNYYLKENDPLINNKFEALFIQSPVFTMNTESELSKFIKKYIKKGDSKKVLFELDKGNIIPSRRLQDDVADMIEGKKQFYLLDTQEDICEKAINMAQKALKTKEKHVLIVKGGPRNRKVSNSYTIICKILSKRYYSTLYYYE